MNNMKKTILLLLVMLILLVQLGHTIANKVTWPFCSHNFYYHRSDKIKPVFRIGLVDDIGEVNIVECRHTLPIEGYRCGSIYREVFVGNDDKDRQSTFAQTILSRLNAGGWKAFDERFSPALPPAGRTYVGLRVEKHYLDTRLYGPTGLCPVTRIEHIYTYERAQET